MGAAHDGVAPLRDPVGRFSCMADSSLAVVCLSPRFYPHCFGSADPLQDGVPRFGGALLSLRRARWTKTRNAISPLSTVGLHFTASQPPPFPPHIPSYSFPLPTVHFRCLLVAIRPHSS